jgi:hypothetical protein
VDYDLLAVDSDLTPLREAGRLPLPTEHEYTILRHGSVKLPYVVLLPDGYDPDRAYPAAVAFAPGGMGTRSTDFTLETLWTDADARGEWILVAAAQPENGWINHPSHHALNALMKKVRKEHKVEENTFHFVGLGSGARPAATYAGMSRRYVRGLTVVEQLPFGNWDDDELAELGGYGFPVTFVVDSRWAHEAGDLHARIGAPEGELVLMDTDGPLLTALTADRLLGMAGASVVTSAGR